MSRLPDIKVKQLGIYTLHNSVNQNIYFRSMFLTNGKSFLALWEDDLQHDYCDYAQLEIQSCPAIVIIFMMKPWNIARFYIKPRQDKTRRAI